MITLHEIDESSKTKWVWPQVHDEFKDYEKKNQVQHILGHETYVQNYI